MFTLKPESKLPSNEFCLSLSVHRQSTCRYNPLARSKPMAKQFAKKLLLNYCLT